MKTDCREYFERVSEYLDGELDAETCERLERHLQDCPECEDCIESLRKAVRFCRESRRLPVPPEVSRRLRAALQECLKR